MSEASKLEVGGVGDEPEFVRGEKVRVPRRFALGIQRLHELSRARMETRLELSELDRVYESVRQEVDSCPEMAVAEYAELRDKAVAGELPAIDSFEAEPASGPEVQGKEKPEADPVVVAETPVATPEPEAVAEEVTAAAPAEAVAEPVVEPVKDGPVAEEPVVAESVKEEPVKEEPKAEEKVEVKPESKAETKAETKPAAKATTKRTPRE